MTELVVVGLGYVGLPLAVLAAQSGIQVTGYDTDKKKIAALRAGDSESPDVASDLLLRLLASQRLELTDSVESLRGFDAVAFCLPTPLAGATPNLSALQSALSAVAPKIMRGSLVIVESSVYPGCTREELRPILERGSGLEAGSDFYLAYSPERINPGDADWNIQNTPKIVSGLSEDCRILAGKLYEKMGIPTVNASSLENAEFCKLLENSFRLVNISLINELSTVASSLGANIWETLELADTKPFGFVKFTPGPGVGGHCLPVDPVYLSWQAKRKAGVDLRMIRASVDVNESMPDFIIRRISQELVARGTEPSAARVLILGLAYKANVADMRESASLLLASRLKDLVQTVVAFDHMISQTDWPPSIARASTIRASDFDIAVVMTAHGIEHYDRLLNSNLPIIDTRNYLPRGSGIEV